MKCGVDRSVAAFCDRLVALVADDEDAGSCFDNVVGDDLELVDLKHPRDLWKEAFEESEVAASDALDGCDGLRVSEVLGVEGAAKASPMSVKDEQQFLSAECPVAV